jgi:hypothetical protein
MSEEIKKQYIATPEVVEAIRISLGIVAMSHDERREARRVARRTLRVWLSDVGAAGPEVAGVSRVLRYPKPIITYIDGKPMPALRHPGGKVTIVKNEKP